MSTLFSPLRIGSIPLGNRTVRSATGEGAAEQDVGNATHEMADFYGTVASGGVGLIITGHVAVSPEGRCSNRMSALYSDAFVPAFRKLVNASHRNGTPIVCQLNHGGRQVNTKHDGIQALGPSEEAFEGATKKPEQALSGFEVERIVGDFASAAGRCKQAGFDGVQIHSAHGYLISQFNSPLTNHRTDRWGGSPDDRRRFLRSVYDAIRVEVGPDYPILVKQNVSDFYPGGLEREEALDICEMLDFLGVAAIELSGGIAESIPVAFQAEGLKKNGEIVLFEDECRKARERVSCPLILTGGIRRRDTAERLLAEGVCEAIGLCRPMIREPNLPEKWRTGEAIQAACTSCGGCASDPDRCNYCVLDE